MACAMARALPAARCICRNTTSSCWRAHTKAEAAGGRPRIVTAAAAARRQPSVADGELPPPPLAFSRGQVLKGALLAAGGALLTSSSGSAALAADPAAAAALVAPEVASQAQTFSKVLMQTLADCQLAVSNYPTFSYDAAGGGGSGVVSPGADGLLRVAFDTATLNIPPVNYQHAAILGIPVPPPLNIAIVPQRLEGTYDPATGRVDLDFLASFEFTAGPYHASPLTVATTLTTEQSDGVLRHGTGSRLTADGRARLVGVARVPRTDDAFLNTFLQLPTDALAVLSAELRFS